MTAFEMAINIMVCIMFLMFVVTPAALFIYAAILEHQQRLRLTQSERAIYDAFHELDWY